MTTRAPLSSARVSYVPVPYTGSGRAEDVVMIHGLGANLGFWYGAASQWFARFGRVTLYDLPGHGSSDMPVSGYSPGQLAEGLSELLDYLKLDRVHLVAHSFGGMIALAFALQQPERVKSIVLADVRLWEVEPPSAARSPSRWVQRMREAGLRLDDPDKDVSFQVLVELAQHRLQSRDKGAALLTALPAAQSLFRGPRAAQRWLQLVETTNIYDEATSSEGVVVADLPKIEVPIMAAYGELSLRKRSAQTLERLCPRCEVKLIPGAGHFFPLTRPRRFSVVAIDFLRSQIGLPPIGVRATQRADIREPADAAMSDMAL